jgi:uncharacterized Tic20 family protein
MGTIGILIIISAIITIIGLVIVHHSVSYENIFGMMIFIGAFFTVVFSIIGIAMMLLSA